MKSLVRIVFVFVAASSCSSEKAAPESPSVPATTTQPPTPTPTPTPTTVTEAERTVLQACADGLPSMTVPNKEMHIPLYITECGGILGWGKLGDGNSKEKIEIIVNSGFFCKPELVDQAMKDDIYDTELLFKECGAEYYSLKEDQSEYLSLSWFFFQRTTAWLQEKQNILSQSDSSAADKALSESLKMRLGAFRPAIPSEGKPHAMGIITPEGAAIVTEP